MGREIVDVCMNKDWHCFLCYFHLVNSTRRCKREDSYLFMACWWEIFWIIRVYRSALVSNPPSVTNWCVHQNHCTCVHVILMCYLFQYILLFDSKTIINGYSMVNFLFLWCSNKMSFRFFFLSFNCIKSLMFKMPRFKMIVTFTGITLLVNSWNGYS